MAENISDTDSFDEYDAKVSVSKPSGNIQTTRKDENNILKEGEKQEANERTDLNKARRPESNIYPMATKPRGLALIINNASFLPKSGFKPRNGSDVDVTNLAELFKYLGFKVFVKNDLKAEKIHEYIDRFKKQFEKMSVDMSAFCIMSHGDNGELVDIDGVGMDVEEDIIKKFYDLSPLIGKPKLFLLQYCRGEKLDYGNSVPLDRDLNKDKLRFGPKLPTVADILIANSTVPGFVSNRNTRHGTWFFQCFIQVFKENAKDMDVRDMLDQVAVMLNDKESNDPDRRKQTFETVNRGFYKKLYFNPVGEEKVEDEETNSEAKEENVNLQDSKEQKKPGLRKKIKEARKSVSDWFTF